MPYGIAVATGVVFSFDGHWPPDFISIAPQFPGRNSFFRR